MNLSDITREDVLAGKCWIVEEGGQDGNPKVRETDGFAPVDLGLVSAVVKIADGSEHLGLVVKSFPQGGDDVDIYIWTNFAWMNIHAPGFLRAIGKYSHDMFPFDYYLAKPWKGGRQPEVDHSSPHPKIFRDTAVRIKQVPAPKKK